MDLSVPEVASQSGHKDARMRAAANIAAFGLLTGGTTHAQSWPRSDPTQARRAFRPHLGHAQQDRWSAVDPDDRLCDPDARQDGLETNDEPQPQSVANKEPPKPVQHRRFDQWLIARGEPLKERSGKAFRASVILAFRNGPSPSCL
jgi:hypothetical protein